ncbi:thiosulfate sulfurtransferase [Halogranum gelatinilyticum]|uniref:Thiosulfate sulfurtransferase n=1 Tax=Halogranum gelatinilyticum TaxID=660521 RepID=A0A1G9Q3L3_9EURY|nr:rhodanese-like domain-containing protein [Halogranum gelatinilyticum]SDM05600.1 thiosulfate sulfurtransferase [Halogranum gelatinilyticum]
MVRELSPSELQEKLNADADLAVLDIRDPQSYADGHIPGSENRPAQRLDASVFEEEWPDEVVVSCYVGKSSKRIAGVLDANLAADVASLRGGFDGWEGDVERASPASR